MVFYIADIGVASNINARLIMNLKFGQSIKSEPI